MNERMIELFEKAGISDSINEEFGIEYLAELIVKECAGIVDGYYYKPTEVANLIRKHFGVE